MSIEEVKNSEELKVAQEDNGFIGYKTRVIDKDVLLAYIFVHNKLVRAKYLLAEPHTNRNDYLIDYSDFNSILTKKYGNPDEDKTIWRDDLYQDNPSEYGTAVGVGHLLKYSKWQTPFTNITTILMGENFDVTVAVEFQSKNIWPARKSEQRAEGVRTILNQAMTMRLAMNFIYALIVALTLSGCMKYPSAKDLEADINRIDQQLIEAKQEKEKYGDGLLSILISLRIETLLNTRAMLNKK